MTPLLVRRRQLALCVLIVGASALAPTVLRAGEAAGVRHVYLNEQNIDGVRSQKLDKVTLEIDAAGNFHIKSDAYRVQAPPTSQAAAPASAPVAAPADVLPQPAVSGPSKASRPAPTGLAGQSLDEAVTWMKGKIDGQTVELTWKNFGLLEVRGHFVANRRDPPMLVRVTETVRGLKHEGCTVSWKLAYAMSSEGAAPDAAEMDRELDLAKLDPVGIRAEKSPPYLAFAHPDVPDGEWVQEPWVVLGLGEDPKLGFHGIQLLVADRELAKRIAAALQHAAEVCGGKVEPY